CVVISILQGFLTNKLLMSKDLEKVASSNQFEEGAPKFKWRKVSAVRDFPPGCESDGLSRQIAVDRSSQGKLWSISRLSGC
ncbi:hypothetical protein J1N35_025907, partial [Gossypium stocksii]